VRAANRVRVGRIDDEHPRTDHTPAAKSRDGLGYDRAAAGGLRVRISDGRRAVHFDGCRTRYEDTVSFAPGAGEAI